MKIRFQEPAEDFTDGIEVICRYHDSFLAQGLRLLELVAEIEQISLNEERAFRLAELYVFYQQANRLHHQDEEKALFPAVVGRDLLLDGMLERLTLDHLEIEEAWQVLTQDLQAILSQHRVPKTITVKAARFEKLQREHLVRENEDFLPRLAAGLTSGQRQQAAEAMAKIRGLKTNIIPAQAIKHRPD